MEIKCTWDELKDFVDTKLMRMQYKEDGSLYKVWAEEGSVVYVCKVYKEDTPGPAQTDFEANWKSKCNKPVTPKSPDGKVILRAESRPLDTTVCFTCYGDSQDDIGDGVFLGWDAGEDTFNDLGNGKKKKIIEFGFIDSVWIKEGTLYFFNAAKGSRLDFFTYCPKGGYYKNNAGVVKQAMENTFFDHFVMGQHFQGTCPVGDELNTECCSAEVPSFMKHQIHITVPSEDTQSNGYMSLELYRKRTMVVN